MDAFFFIRPETKLRARESPCKLAVAAILPFVLLLFELPVPAQKAPGEADQAFKRLAAQLSEARLSGATENGALQEKALRFLDALACDALNSPGGGDLDHINERLAGLVSHDPPIGENYHLVPLGGNPTPYVLVANFGLGGPAAIRIYKHVDGRYSFAARIDHYVQKDFFDSDLELIPISITEAAFVIAAGRADDLATGMFSAWRFDGRQAVMLWSSDLLPQSSYLADGDGFHLAYCSEPDDDHPSRCPKMSKDLYRLEAGEWKRIESIASGSPPPAKK